MAKYRPLRHYKTRDLPLAVFGALVDLTDNYLSGFTREYIYCGNCGERLLIETNDRLPLVCRKCGEEIDWTEDPQKLGIKVCPQCNKQYEMEDYFCTDHVPKVALEKR